MMLWRFLPCPFVQTVEIQSCPTEPARTAVSITVDR